MKKKQYILFTAGRGPVECGLAVHGVQLRFKKYLQEQELDFEIIKQQRGQNNYSIETILFKVDRSRKLKSWLGTIQWVCKSPIRKFAKRKNWFIKSCEVFVPDPNIIDLKDITVQSYRASGPGGQHRNKVETAIRLIHRPSGIIVTAADSKSKAQNKKKALVKLEVKLKSLHLERQGHYDLQEWAAKVEIQRGNPTKVFYGPKFIEI